MASHQDHEKPSASSSERPQMLSVHDHDHDEKLNGADELPSPVSSPLPRPTPAGKAKLSATAIIPVWICLSSAVIIYNNYLYNTLNFRYPVFLVTWHLTFAVRYEGFLPLLNPFVRSVSSLPPFFFLLFFSCCVFDRFP